jgi:hypothetical protein
MTLIQADNVRKIVRRYIKDHIQARVEAEVRDGMLSVEVKLTAENKVFSSNKVTIPINSSNTE